MTSNKTKQTKKAIAIPVTREACDACSISNNFLDVLLTQTVHSAPLSLGLKSRKANMQLRREVLLSVFSLRAS